MVVGQRTSLSVSSSPSSSFLSVMMGTYKDNNHSNNVTSSQSCCTRCTDDDKLFYLRKSDDPRRYLSSSTTISPTTTEDALPKLEQQRIIYGPSVTFEKGKIAYLVDSSVLGSSGDTVALATVSVSPLEEEDENSKNKNVMMEKNQGIFAGERINSIDDDDDNEDRTTILLIRQCLQQKCQHESSSHIVPLTVDYRQRHHAVGKIPAAASKMDNRRPTVMETLASRAVDRALRPLLKKKSLDGEDGDKERTTNSGKRAGVERIHLNCSIQSCPLQDSINDDDEGTGGSGRGRGGHPVALALNSASVALGDRLIEPVAAVSICLLEDGTIVTNSCSNSIAVPAKATNATTVNGESSSTTTKSGGYGELLYAGTRDAVVMMEFSGNIEETHLKALLAVAHNAIQPILDVLESSRDVSGSNNNKIELDDDALRAELGLPVAEEKTLNSSKSYDSLLDESRQKASVIYDEAMRFCQEKLLKVALRLFGCTNEDLANNLPSTIGEDNKVTIHDEAAIGPLLGKSHRGRREHLFREEIGRQVRSFVPSDASLVQDYEFLVRNERPVIEALADAIHSQLLRAAMEQAAMKYKRRADGRGGPLRNGCKTIRPLSIDVPILPDAVHGSALFGRGETQVLVTTTLGSPKDTMPILDPFQSASNQTPAAEEKVEPFHDLPVGSLRYLKTSGSQYIEADLNTRRIMADREQTGDSGTLKERRRGKS
jgi:hypothetical protein